MSTSPMSALRAAANVDDTDSATIFANVLNNDLAAVKALGGRNHFDTDDALRIGRIMGEYQRISKATPVPTRSAFTPRT